MKIFKLLKHDKKTHIHIKDHPDNHAYIISVMAVTLMSLQESLQNFSIESYELHFKVPTSYTSNLGIIDILVEGTQSFTEKLELLLSYNNHIEKLDNVPSIIEVIDVIDSVKPQPIITSRDIKDLMTIDKPFSLRPGRDNNNGGWKTLPGTRGSGGWTTH